MKKKAYILISIILGTQLICAPFYVSAETSKFSDLSGHWGEPYMLKAVSDGLMNGIGGNRIAPGDKLMRAELATIVNRAFGATKTTDITGFRDVPRKEWYYNEIAKAVAMGALKGTSATQASPTGHVTREEAFTIIGRVFNLDFDDTSALARFKDSDDVSDFARGATAAMVTFGYAQGDLGCLRPQGEMTRAEFAALMCRMVEQYLMEDGGVKENTTVNGTVMINVPNYTLINATIQGDLIIGDGCTGTVVLKNCTVNGRVLTRGEANLVNENSTIHGGVETNVR